MEKTLIGKFGYLFLNNDSCKELEIHNNNLCLVDNNFYKKYEPFKDKILFIIFPNKSLIYSHFLPDNYDLKYRPGFDIYKKYFNNQIIDGYDILKNIDDTYYKTDTHININGSLIIFNNFIKKINEIFNLNIITPKYTLNKITCNSLTPLYLGIGDLTWYSNLGNQILETTIDSHYEINESAQIYMKYIFCENSSIKLLLQQNNMIIDDTNNNINKLLDWTIISKYILYKENIFSENIFSENKIIIIIFYDSFLCSTLQLYMKLFYKIYLIKSIYNLNLINLIKPDYIFEFRCERFLV